MLTICALIRRTYDYQAKEAIGQSWLISAKLARKAAYWNTAYSAVLQAQYGTPAFTIVESAKLAKASGDPVRAFQELDSYYQIAKQAATGDIVDLTEGDKELRQKAKVGRIQRMESLRCEHRSYRRSYFARGG